MICAYSDDRWPLLRRAVASAVAQRPAPVETVVVIDHNDALLARARADLPGALVVENAGPRGISGARNAGWVRTTGEVVAFLDDDAAADPGWLAALLAEYARPDVIGVGGLILPDWERTAPVWLPEEFYWVFGCSYRGLPKDAAVVRNLIGANMSFRRSALEAVSGFSPEIGHVGESMPRCDETEFCIRLTAALPDGHILYTPRPVVRHHVPAERTSWRYYRIRCFTEGQAKAHLSRMVGASEALSSERRHALRTLPQGIGRELASPSRAGLRRAAAIIAGFGLTAAGFSHSKARSAIFSRQPH